MGADRFIYCREKDDIVLDVETLGLVGNDMHKQRVFVKEDITGLGYLLCIVAPNPISFTGSTVTHEDTSLCFSI